MVMMMMMTTTMLMMMIMIMMMMMVMMMMMMMIRVKEMVNDIRQGRYSYRASKMGLLITIASDNDD